MAPQLEARVCSVWLRDPPAGGRRAPSTPTGRALNAANVLQRRRCQDCCEVTLQGVVGDQAWHKTAPEFQMVVPEANQGERAVLAQCRQHYSEMKKKFPNVEGSFDGEEAQFGEQLILDGVSAATVAIGDVFESDSSSLRLQVTMPRVTCIRPDKRHPTGLLTGQPGTVRQFTSATGRGGMFFRVLSPGSVAEGDVLRLASRRRPGWTVERVAGLCYGTTPLRVTFAGTRAELRELCRMPEFGVYEWKERLWPLLDAEQQGVQEARGAQEPAPAAGSGDGTLANVGIRLGGMFKCPHCRQQFDTNRALGLHNRFAHFLGRQPEDACMEG